MLYKSLGRSGLKVSAIALGTMNFGQESWGCTKPEAELIVDRFVDLGGNLIDTAFVYNGGEVEHLLGSIIGSKRDKLIIASKIGGFLRDNINSGGCGRGNILNTVTESLSALNTDYIDLLQIHSFDYTTPIEETLRCLSMLVDRGLVRYIGCCNFAAWQLYKSVCICDKSNFHPVSSIQLQYSLVCRDIEAEHVPAALDAQIGLLAWSPLGGGMLTGKVGRMVTAPKGARVSSSSRTRERLNERALNICEYLITAAKELETTESQLALSWLLRRPAVTSAIVGVRSVDQLESNCMATTVRLPDDVSSKLDELSRLEVLHPYDTQLRVDQQWSRHGYADVNRSLVPRSL